MGNKTKAIFFVAICILIGIVVGAVLDRFVFMNLFNPKKERNYREELVKRLNLNKDQQVRLDSILSWSQNQFKNLSKEFRPKFDSLKNALHDSIRAILTPEQRAEFEKMIKEKTKRK